MSELAAALRQGCGDRSPEANMRADRTEAFRAAKQEPTTVIGRRRAQCGGGRMRALIKIGLGLYALILVSAAVTAPCAAQFLGVQPDGRMAIKLFDTTIGVPVDTISGVPIAKSTNPILISSHIPIKNCNLRGDLIYGVRLAGIYNDPQVSKCLFDQTASSTEKLNYFTLLFVVWPDGSSVFGDFARQVGDLLIPGLNRNDAQVLLYVVFPKDAAHYGQAVPPRPFDWDQWPGSADALGYKYSDILGKPSEPPKEIRRGYYYLPADKRLLPASKPLKVFCGESLSLGCQSTIASIDAHVISDISWRAKAVPQSNWIVIDKLHRELLNSLILNGPKGLIE